jgi:hypothetical protein
VCVVKILLYGSTTAELICGFLFEKFKVNIQTF